MLRTSGLIVVGAALGGLTLLKIRDDQYVEAIRRDLEQTPSSTQAFSPDMVASLPDPARRFFEHAIQPGTRLASRAYLTQAGSIRFGTNWLRFNAHQVLVPGRGFIWKAVVRLGPIPVRATDHYVDGQSRMRISGLGLVPFINEQGPDLSRSAAGRLMVEYMWLPTAWLPQAGATIEPLDADRFAVAVSTTNERARLVLTVDRDGRLIDSAFPRYGNQTPDQHYQYIPFGGPMDEESKFDGYTIPSRIRAGWWYGTEQYQEAFRFQITSARFE